MGDISLDRGKFLSRMKIIFDAWNDAERFPTLQTVDAIISGVGADEGVIYSKSTALQTWLFGYELNDTVSVITQDGIYFLSSKKKVDFLRILENNKENQNGVPAVHLLVRDKTDKDAQNYRELIGHIKKSRSGKVIGEFLKDQYKGEFLELWDAALKAERFEKVDVSSQLATIMAPKDESEINIIKKACEHTCLMFQKYLREQIIDIVDSEKSVKHAKLAESTEAALQDKKFHPPGLDPAFSDVCYPPIIQSGGNYQLKFSIVSDKRNVDFSAIICSLGTRYKSYCSNVVRTILVDPSQELQDIYALLLDLENAVLEKLTEGTKLSEVYDVCIKMLKSKRPDLIPKFSKNVGFGMGLEFRESSLLISPKNEAVVEKGMVFNINLGFTDVANPTAKTEAGKTVAFFVGDTVVVAEDGPATSLTEAAKKKLKSVCLFFKKDEEMKEDDSKQEDLEDILSRGKRSVVLQEQLRKKQTGEEKRKQHQRELAESLNRQAQERLAQAKEKPSEQRMKKSNVSYKNPSAMPNEDEVKQMKIYVDKRQETVILPIFGIPTPFHISMIKNISQSVEGDFTYLRINFFYPGATLIKEASAGVVANNQATFLKELTFRSSNLKEPGELSAVSSNLNTAFRLIKEVQKKFKTREAEEREKEGIVKQDKLVISANKANPRLKDLYIRPNMTTKRISGSLEAHINGFRYTSIRGDKVDIMYNNIKHAYFQPCDHELIIVLHFHLKHALLIGKKKHVDIQLYTEVGEINTDLGKHQHMHDRDDIYAEQAERELRHKLNTAFKTFCERVEKLTTQEVEFDTPFRDLGFTGVPHRSSVLLQPTSGSLVNLTDWPPFVVTLEEVELVHFERVSFQHKNFDMVFVFKDYTKKPAMVTAVPTNMLDHVKEWLDSCEIRYTEGIQSLNWPKIMKTITDDAEGFFTGGGWNFLNSESDNEGDAEEEDSDEEDDAYRPSGDEEEGSDEASEEESDDEYESEVETSESGSDVDGSMSSGEESGKSWSELEEEARKADKEKGDIPIPEPKVDPKKRKAAGPPARSAPAKKRR